MTRARITGTGMCVPTRLVTNDDLAERMDTSDEWIRQRSGIVTRYYVEPGKKPSELAHVAVQRALDAAALGPRDIDLIILATLSAEADVPGTSFFLHDRRGLTETPSYDLRATCSGFVYSLSAANAFVRSGQYRRVLVIGCEIHSTGVDHTTEGRDVAVLFGDGAGAVVVEANEDADDPAEILEVRLHAEGSHADKLWIEAPGSAFQPTRITHELIDQKRHFPRMQGRLVFKHATRRMPEVLLEALSAASLKLEEVDHFLFHQANLRINEFVAQQLGIPAEKCPS